MPLLGRDDAPSRLETVEQRPFPQRPPLAGAGRHWQQKAAASDDQRYFLNRLQSNFILLEPTEFHFDTTLRSLALLKTATPNNVGLLFTKPINDQVKRNWGKCRSI